MTQAFGQQWQGKKWYCYGTSMTDNRDRGGGTVGFKPDGQPNCPVYTGFYSGALARLAGLEEHNFGKGSSGILPAIHGEDSIKSRVMTLADGKAEADLITIELIPNDLRLDDARSKLGEVTDWSDDTFCGNLNQMLAWVAENTRAVIAVLITNRCRYGALDLEHRYHPADLFVQTQLQWEEAVEKLCRMHGIPCWNGAAEANLGFFRMGLHTEYVQDQVHLTEKGGQVLAQYYWGKLQSLYPID